MKNSKSLSVSENIIKAVNTILYDGNTGIDCSGLVNDVVTGSGRNRELVKMGIGLTLKKMAVEVSKDNKKHKKEGCFKKEVFEKLTFVGYSVILDVVSYSYEENGKQFEGRMPASEWESLEIWQESMPEPAKMQPVDFSQKSTLRTVPEPYNPEDVED